LCEEACLICEQCEKFKDGCPGQTGSFDRALCPNTIIVVKVS